MPTKTNLVILVGGKSAEHEISLISASYVIKAVDKEQYEVIIIGIDKEGRWFLIDDQGPFLATEPPKKIDYHPAKAVGLVPGENGKVVGLNNPAISLRVDVVFPVLHGTFGEDGTVQGLLELANVPYVGAGVLGSSVGMDKDVMKRLMRDAAIPSAKFLVYSAVEQTDFTAVKRELGMPIFIKPANLGSSVGIHKANDETEFLAGIKDAFRYDQKIILEENIVGREIECSVLGNEDPKASTVGEIITQNHAFYDYDAKYLDAEGALLKIPAAIPAETIKQYQELAIKAYQALGCSGMARVDGFLKEDGEVLINEINTIPGFTQISMYPKLWEASGLKYPDLIDRLIELAFDRHKKNLGLKRDFE